MSPVPALLNPSTTAYDDITLVVGKLFPEHRSHRIESLSVADDRQHVMVVCRCSHMLKVTAVQFETILALEGR